MDIEESKARKYYLIEQAGHIASTHHHQTQQHSKEVLNYLSHYWFVGIILTSLVVVMKSVMTYR
jgi:hypothetical protein